MWSTRKHEEVQWYNKHDQGMNCQRFVFVSLCVCVCVYLSSSRIVCVLFVKQISKCFSFVLVNFLLQDENAMWQEQAQESSTDEITTEGEERVTIVFHLCHFINCINISHSLLLSTLTTLCFKFKLRICLILHLFMTYTDTYTHTYVRYDYHDNQLLSNFVSLSQLCEDLSWKGGNRSHRSSLTSSS